MAENKIDREKPSRMAEGMALHRVVESSKPENERICYDPYAIHFISQETLKILNSSGAKVASKHYENLFPGLANSIRVRVRYFDDFVKKSITEGIEQLVMLGAGYDTRAYRIEGLKNVKVFELDHPNTQSFKTRKIREIFGSLPDHVMFIPVDFEKETPGKRLLNEGYSPLKKTLFIMEGLIMYIPQEAVDETLSFIVENSGKGSSVIFDYYHESVVDGSCELEAGKNIRNYTMQQGEPLQFGIEERKIEQFLTKRGFSRIQNITSEDYKKAYFHGVNKNRDVCELLYFVHAFVE